MNAPATNIGIDLAARARAVSSLREFLELLEEQGQLIHWRDRVLPEPDIRKVAVAAGRDVNGAPAIVFDNIAGYPGKKTVVGVHGSWNNMATLFGMPRGTTIREMFFELAGRWGRTGAQITHVPPGEASVHQCRIEQDINLYDLLPVYRINEYDGGFYLAKASVASRDPQHGDARKQAPGGIRPAVSRRHAVRGILAGGESRPRGRRVVRTHVHHGRCVEG